MKAMFSAAMVLSLLCGCAAPTDTNRPAIWETLAKEQKERMEILRFNVIVKPAEQHLQMPVQRSGPH